MDIFLNIEREILSFIKKNYSRKKFLFWGAINPVSLKTDIRDDLNVLYEDAGDLFTYFFYNWKVEFNDFSLDRYFSPEYLGSPPPEKPLEPITINMLVESAKAGQWLY
ncbi:TPA: DUF1493 family protein [Serratia marcescens]|uniref:DUF1493 family protein n=1 Tax=Serratia marcescens TaxID=615 RepID=UPI0005358CC5